MRGWLILTLTLLVGAAIGAVAATRGPEMVASYVHLPKAASGLSQRIDGHVVRKQRDGNRLLVKVSTAEGPMLVTFTDKAADLDVLLDAGDTVTLFTRGGYATFVDDPALERVQSPAGAAPPSPPPAASGPAPSR